MLSGSPFQFCSRCGHEVMLAVSDREFVCQDCGYRHFITPFPAACALVLDASGRLLVTRRGHEPGLGKLGLPGGVIEPGETGEEAAARETCEEVGLDVPAAAFRYFASLPNWYYYQDYLWPTLDLFFVVERPDLSHLVPSPEEVSEILLLPLAEVPLAEFAFDSNREAVRRLQEERARPFL